MPTKKELNDAARRQATKEKQMEEIVKQVTNTRKRPDRDVQVEEGDNRRYLANSLEIYNLPKIDINNAEEVSQRVGEYFAICEKNDMKPSVAGLALALDIDRTYLWEIRVGKANKNAEVVDALKRAMKILDLQMVDYMQNGKINPVSGIFLMKNNFGYQDKQEVVVTPNNPLGDGEATEELADKYSDSIVDVDYTEKKEDS